MILEEEKQAVIRYALAHPKDGYRRLAWQMVDEDVAYVSPSSVYRILNDADLLYRWKRGRGVGEPPPRPQRPNERWHTDIMYLRVEGTWYFLVTVLDGYSRFVVHWELLTSMRAADVRLVIQQAGGLYESTTYDVGGRLATRQTVRPGTTTPLQDEQHFYDARGKVLRVDAAATVGRMASQFSQWYSGLGHLVATDWDNMDSPEWQREEYRVDVLGNVVHKRVLQPGVESPSNDYPEFEYLCIRRVDTW